MNQPYPPASVFEHEGTHIARGDTVFVLAETFLSSGQVRLLDLYGAGRQSLNRLAAQVLELPLKDGLVQVLRGTGNNEGQELVRKLSAALFSSPDALVARQLETLDLVHAPSEMRASRQFAGMVLDVQATYYARSGYSVRNVLLWDGTSTQIQRHRLPRMAPVPELGARLTIQYGPRGRPFVTAGQ